MAEQKQSKLKLFLFGYRLFCGKLLMLPSEPFPLLVLLPK